jgi:predicted acetyltransferase
MKIINTTIDKILNYRKYYLNSLPEFQELFIEIMLHDSNFYLLRYDNKDVGYVVTNNENVLIEFHVFEKHLPESHNFFKQVLVDLSIKVIYCKSFDSQLLSNCLLSSLPYSVIGVLYRNYVEPLVKLDSSIKMKKTDLSSVSLLNQQDESIKELFETEDQLTEFIKTENVFEFYKNDEFVGCGMVLKTNSSWNYCDLGVWVKPSERGNRIGSQIIINLKEFAIKNNLKPSCGCAIENIASQKTIERSGFVSKYKLINFTT